MNLFRSLSASRRIPLHWQRKQVFLAALPFFLVVAILLELTQGAVLIPAASVLGILLDALGLPHFWPFEPRHQAILLNIRLPRVALGLLVGGALAVSGAAMQGLFRNPLADPGLIGVSAGAALAAAMTIVLGDLLMVGFMQVFGWMALPTAAFIGGLAATVLTYWLSRHTGHTSVATMLIAGIAINAAAISGIGMLSYLSTDKQLRDLTFWMMGSLSGSTWRTLLPATPLLLAAIVVLPRLWAGLNALLLGEREAFHLGEDTERLKRTIVITVAMGVGAAAAVSGVIQFVGLMVPHLVRLALGPDHRLLLPASVVLGATLVLFADVAARTMTAPAELPIGIVTSLIGAPFLLGLLLRQRRRWL